jgi:nucleotide-binding universal stress UspA family protein
MKHIVVGVDRSEGSAIALRWACRLAARHDGEVVVMTGYEPTDAEMPPGRLDTLVTREERELAAWVASLDLDKVPVRVIVEPGDPREVMLGVASRAGADLIVVGRVGQSLGPGLFHLGSLAEWLAHHADRPVAVIGDGVDDGVDHAISNVLVAVDGSDGARAAAAWVRDLSTAGDLRIVAAAVEEVPVEPNQDDRLENWRRELEQRIGDDYAADLLAVGAEPVALRGSDVADALLQAAQVQQSDLVVVGARGLGGLTGLRLGGVALETLHEVDRPLVLVPPG